MVKKISGQPPRTQSTTAVHGARNIEGAKVGGVEQVKTTEQRSGVGRVKGQPIQITPELHQQLLQMIDEEAEKMFGGANGIPRERRETLTGAVKMAISAGLIEDENDSPPKKK